jgi:hypothetical protein
MQDAPYIGTETVDDFPVAGSVTLMTTQAGPRTRVIPGNWVMWSVQAVSV